MGKRTNTAVWMDKQSRWQIKVQKNGIRRTFYSSTKGRTGQREANAKADAWLDDGVESHTLKVAKALDEYLFQLSLTASTSHYRQTEYICRLYIKERIGNVRISDLHEQHLQSVIDYAYSRKLSKKTLKDIRGGITAFMKYCRKCNYTKLTAQDLTIPNGAPVKEKTILQPKALQTLFTIDTTTYGRHEVLINAYRFQTITGLRPGELIGLKWTDIFKDTVHIERSINMHGETTTGKNDNARRSFKLTELSKAILDAQEHDGEYIFSIDGDHISQRKYRDHWRAYCKANKLPESVTPYGLRHTFVSVVKALPEGYLKALVGHSEDMDTYGIYSHSLTDDQTKTAELVEKIFNDILHPEEDSEDKNAASE